MKILWVMFFLSLSSKLWAFPEVLSWQNRPTVVFDNKKQAILVAKGLLKRPFVVANEKYDRLELKINHFDKIQIFENTKAQILDFNNDGEFVGEFYLLEGRIRYRSELGTADKKDQNIVIKTPFFDLPVKTKVDFYIELNMKEAWVELRVIEGSMPVSFFAYEKQLQLTEGQAVRFQGEVSDDKQTIRYDYLLGGKKSPRGQLQDTKSFDREAYLKADEAARMAEIKRKKDLEFKRLEKIRKQKAYEDSFLCKKPFGQRDQCAWWVEKSKCYRKRCNVSGQWGDVIERPMGPKCKSDFIVDVCDY